MYDLKKCVARGHYKNYSNLGLPAIVNNLPVMPCCSPLSFCILIEEVNISLMITKCTERLVEEGMLSNDHFS